MAKKLDLGKIAANAAAATAGGALASVAMNKLGENVNPVFKAAGLVVIGAFAPMLDKSKGGIMEALGAGVMGAAGATLANNFMTPATTSGVGYADDVMYEELSGLEDEQALAGADDEDMATA